MALHRRCSRVLGYNMTCRQVEICTRRQPWQPDHGLPVAHPDAVPTAEVRLGVWQWGCPNCGTEWEGTESGKSFELTT